MAKLLYPCSLRKKFKPATMLKITLTLIAFAAAVSAQNVEWNECQQRCLEEGGRTGCTTAWNETECFCSTEQFATDVRHCFYENSCWTDIQPFYEAREARCGDLARDVSFEDRPGMGGSNVISSTSSASRSASASTTASAAASSSLAASASQSQVASGAVGSGATNTENAGNAVVPTWSSKGLASGAITIAGVIVGVVVLV